MTDPNIVTEAPPQPDAAAMAAIMAKVAKIQKILGFLTYSQFLLALLLLAAPLLPTLFGPLPQSFGFMLVAPFLLGLAYSANFAKKDLSFARVVFRNTAISQLGLLVIALIEYLAYPSIIMLVLVLVALCLGGLAGMVIYQATKEQK
jgi:hypothetical protein